MGGPTVTTPPCPENVRIVRGDTEIPVELVYDGQDEDGIHTWTITTAVDLATDRILVGVLPAHCGIAFAAAKDGDRR